MTTQSEQSSEAVNQPAHCAEQRMKMKLGDCLRKGCVICIEHASTVQPRFTPWQIWGNPSCYNGDLDSIDREIESCKEIHTDHHIRLNIEDFGFRSKMSLMVHRPGS